MEDGFLEKPGIFFVVLTINQTMFIENLLMISSLKMLMIIEHSCSEFIEKLPTAFCEMSVLAVSTMLIFQWALHGIPVKTLAFVSQSCCNFHPKNPRWVPFGNANLTNH